MKRILLILLLNLWVLLSGAQPIDYGYPVQYHRLGIEGKTARMAYMDVASANPNGQTVLLLHGKNFNGFYWKEVISFLSTNGYRVVVPDQVGWGLSDKPNIHYSFHGLAAHTKSLLDSLGISKVHVVGHSMGGMLATRFTLMYPQAVAKLVYENPIGLEDYRTFVPYRSIEEQYNNELKADSTSLKKYQQTYYPRWQVQYEPYVEAQWKALQYPVFETATWASALAYQMIYEQPVVYEFRNIKKPTLIIIGAEDRTVVGKNLLTPAVAARHGHYPTLAQWLQRQIRGSQLSLLKGVGHIPHIQVPGAFQDRLLAFLRN